MKPSFLSSWKRRGRLFWSGIALLAVAAVFFSSCSSTITPPADPPDPCRVFLLREAKHAGIVLPRSDDAFAEFAFGDWDWYALLEDSWYDVFGTVLWPTQGCLGRRSLDIYTVGLLERTGRLHPLCVDRSRARSLLEELDKRFESGSASMIHNQRNRLSFVEDEKSFWFLYNCNDSVADWMERLGCDVSWALIRTGIELEENRP